VNENIERGVREKSSLRTAFRIILPDGTIKYIEATNYPAFSASEELLDIVVTGIDVTERKRAEEAYREAQLELAHANRSRQMGQLTASIAHEVNQPDYGSNYVALAARRWLSAEPPNLHEVMTRSLLLSGGEIAQARSSGGSAHSSRRRPHERTP